ncbi:STAS domain-containing protein [Streptomyces sp. NPDC051567]|uniref:STAS domain-containing protein n=1 Tax=Streptomyces sp. NPDC051567 TaxID=3365660 RepID=UPI0037BA9706
MDVPILSVPAPRDGAFPGAGSPARPRPLPCVRATLLDGVLSVTLAGEFDHHTCAPLHGLLARGAAHGARRLVLDTALVSFCDSALLHVLDQWALAGRRAELVTTSRAVRLLLAAAGRARARRRARPGG